MNNKEAKEAVKELMDQFNSKREQWIAKFGSDKGFDEWFSGQVANVPENQGLPITLRKTNADVLQEVA